MSDEIRATLDQRGANYGKFIDNAIVSEQLMDIIRAHPGYAKFLPDQRVATWVIMQKLARALSGNAQYDDNWRDMAGYAQLIVDRINGTGTYTPEPRLVVLSDCFREGSIIPASAAKSARCRNCHANVGDVHAPDCREGQEASPTG